MPANTYFVMKSSSGSTSTSMDDPQLLRVSLPKPLGIQLEEVQAGFPGVRVAGVVEGGTAKENGVRYLEVSQLWYDMLFMSSSYSLVG